MFPPELAQPYFKAFRSSIANSKCSLGGLVITPLPEFPGMKHSDCSTLKLVDLAASKFPSLVLFSSLLGRSSGFEGSENRSLIEETTLS